RPLRSVVTVAVADEPLVGLVRVPARVLVVGPVRSRARKFTPLGVLTGGEEAGTGEFLPRACGRGIPVIFAFGEHVPHDHGDFTSDGGERDVVGLAVAQPFE